MPSPMSSNRQLPSWRGAPTVRGHSSSTRWIAALVVSALFALLGWLLWALLPSRLPHTHVVAITTGEAHKFLVPPIPFADEDLARFAQDATPSCRFYDLSRLQEANNIRDLGRSLQGLSLKAADVLVVYVSAHGVSDNGTAYLLCRDYDLQNKDSGRYAVTELLDQLQPLSATTKLLVLDSLWILSDPRLGMLVNEFPLLVADEVAPRHDPSLGVLLSCSMLQNPTVQFTKRQTLFGSRFAEGLLGSADVVDRGGNEDGFVALDELFNFLVVDCREESGGTQIPVLLHAGQRLNELTRIPPDIRLAWSDLPSQAVEDQPAADKAHASDKVAPQEKNAVPASAAGKIVSGSEPTKNVVSQQPTSEDTTGLARDDVSTAPAAKATTGASNVGDESATVIADKLSDHLSQESKNLPLAALLHQAWQLRDDLEALPETTAQWWPLEYAPLQWRELNALLLDIDLRSRAGKAFDEKRSRAQLMTQLEGMHRLQREEWLRTPTEDRSLVVQRLLTSASRFAASPERATFTTESRELREVGEAVRYSLRLSFRVSDYTRCYAEMIANWEDSPDLAEVGKLLERLAQGLLEFQEQLQARENQRLVISSTEDALVALARSLRETEDTLRTKLQDLLTFLAANATHPVNRDRIARLLRSPVWTAAQRQKLIASLNLPITPAKRSPEEGSPLPQQWSVPARQWERISQLGRLQAKQAQLAGASDTSALASQLKALDTALRASNENDGRIWPEVRALGQTCERLQLSLLKRVAQDGDVAAARWLDARDASMLAVSEQRDGFPQLRLLAPHQPDRLDVAQRPLGALRLDEVPVAIEIEVHPSNSDVRSVSITPQYDEKQLRLVPADDSRPLLPGRPVSLQVDANRVARFRWQINLAAGFVEDKEGGQYPIELMVTAGALSVPHTIQCALPKPNEVELIVERIDPPEQARRFGRNGTELRPLVNRTTHFRFSLANLSGQDKQVDVALYQIPGSSWTPGRLLDEHGEPFADLRSWLFQTATDQLLPGVEPVARTAAPVTLPADARPREVDLSPKPAPTPELPAGTPAPGEPAPGEATPGEPAAKEPVPPKEPSRVEITYGLACVITNVSNPGERWVKWIEINPLTPREYVAPKVSYDPDLEEITIEVRGLDANADSQPDRLPSQAELIAKPIEVAWDTAGVVPTGAERNDLAFIDHAQAVARLNARVPSHPTRSAVIRLNVDGFPRAFVSELALNRKNEGRDIRRDERSIRIVSLQIRNEDRVFRTTREEAGAKDDPGDAKTEVLYLQPGAPAVFAVPGKGDAILVGFEVDAPLDTFAIRDRDEVIEIGFAKAGFQSTQLHADRPMQAWLAEVTSTSLAVSTHVGDYTGEDAVPLDITGLKNARLKIQARLRMNQDNPPPHELDVVLDSEPPVLTSLHAPAAAKQGQPIPVSVDVMDMSGPSKAVFGLVPRRGDELKDDQATILEEFSATAIADRWPITVSLDSASLQPDDYFVKVRVTDRVGKHTDIVGPITILAPPPAKEDKPKPLVGSIHGVVRFGPTFHPDRITVRLNASTIEPTTTNNGGRFRFDNVPAGKYILEARGPVRGYIKEGMTEVELKQKADYAREILIDLGDGASQRNSAADK